MKIEIPLVRRNAWFTFEDLIGSGIDILCASTVAELWSIGRNTSKLWLIVSTEPMDEAYSMRFINDTLEVRVCQDDGDEHDSSVATVNFGLVPIAKGLVREIADRLGIYDPCDDVSDWVWVAADSLR